MSSANFACVVSASMHFTFTSTSILFFSIVPPPCLFILKQIVFFVQFIILHSFHVFNPFTKKDTLAKACNARGRGLFWNAFTQNSKNSSCEKRILFSCRKTTLIRTDCSLLAMNCQKARYPNVRILTPRQEMGNQKIWRL